MLTRTIFSTERSDPFCRHRPLLVLAVLIVNYRYRPHIKTYRNFICSDEPFKPSKKKTDNIATLKMYKLPTNTPRFYTDHDLERPDELLDELLLEFGLPFPCLASPAEQDALLNETLARIVDVLA